MAEENTTSSFEGAPELTYIPDQVVAAGRDARLNLSAFVIERPGETVSYSIEDFPDGFVVDESTGIVTGTAPRLELNETKLVGVRVNSSNGLETLSLFNLEIIGTILLDTPEAKAYFGDEPVNFWDAAADWEIQQFIQQLLNEHFVYIYFHDGDNPPESSGKFLDKKVAKTGWNIYHFKDVVMINAGEKTFAQYGNRKRLIDTVREVFQSQIQDRKWANIGLNGSDADNIGRAWIVGKQLNAPVSEFAPTELAEVNYHNMENLQRRLGGIEPKPR